MHKDVALSSYCHVQASLWSYRHGQAFLSCDHSKAGDHMTPATNALYEIRNGERQQQFSPQADSLAQYLLAEAGCFSLPDELSQTLAM